LQPEFAGAHLTLSSVLQQQGDAQGAAAERRIGDEISRKNNNRQAAMFATNFAKKMLQSGDLEGALKQLQTAIQSDPNFADAHFQLGLVLRQKGDFTAARQEFYKAQQLEAQQINH
jgi:Tfp pilus assembly protein PilF